MSERAFALLREGTEILRTGGGTTLTAEQCNVILDRVQELEERELLILQAFYDADYRECARICDEVLDRSGALLGRIRALSQSPAQERK